MRCGCPTLGHRGTMVMMDIIRRTRVIIIIIIIMMMMMMMMIIRVICIRGLPCREERAPGTGHHARERRTRCPVEAARAAIRADTNRHPIRKYADHVGIMVVVVVVVVVSEGAFVVTTFPPVIHTLRSVAVPHRPPSAVVGQGAIVCSRPDQR